VFTINGILWEISSFVTSVVNLFVIVSGLVEAIIPIGGIFLLLFCIDVGYLLFSSYDEAWALIMETGEGRLKDMLE